MKQKLACFSVVKLFGTWEDMGRQYGEDLQCELRDVYDRMLRQEIERNAPLASQWREEADTYYASLPCSLKRFFRGMEKGSGLPLDTLKLVCVVEYLKGLAGCSALAVWGEYTENGLIFGRNYDYTDAYRVLRNDVVLTVFHPSDGSQAVATLGYVGQIYAVTGLNESGIFMELNNATPTGGTEYLTDRIYAPVSLLRLLFEADSLEAADRFFETTRSNCAYLIGVTDGTSARGYEWEKLGMKPSRAAFRGSCLALTNSYEEPDWPYPVPREENCWQAGTRRCHLRTRAQALKGHMNAAALRELMSTPIAEGGALFEDLSLYQLVYDPARHTLWLRVIDGCDWTPVDTRELFK